MPRPKQTDEQSKKLLPIVCQVFTELGYQRTTTAELARRCGVRENILYRLWQDKKAMFLAAIADIFNYRANKWDELLADHPEPRQAIERLVAFEATHQGEFGFYRIVFTALAESDDADIRAALIGMYRRFHRLVCVQIEIVRAADGERLDLPVDEGAWALIGLATISNIIRELKLLPARRREQMFGVVAKYLILGETA